jgi:DNA-damage-inducible protein J
MANTDVVRARIDGTVKGEAAAVLAAMGLTVSDAFRMMMVRIAHDKRLPFDPLVPNETTIAAIAEARSGGLPRFADVSALMDDLNADGCAGTGTDRPIQEGLEAGGQRSPQ